MIGYLRGKILENSDGKLILGVGNTEGMVGYSLSIPQNSIYSSELPGSQVELFVHTHVREEAFDLYGFTSSEEKALFLTLLSVNGIGPKSALGILSAIESSQLIHALVQGDQALLSSVSGIGKKTAERLVLELKDKIKKKLDSGVLKARGLQSGNNGPAVPISKFSQETKTSEILKDAKSALLGLGYRELDVQILLTQVIENSDVPYQKAEDLIRTALKRLAI